MGSFRHRGFSATQGGRYCIRAFEKRHPELKARRVRSIDWKRHENNTYVKIVYWFEVIGKVI